MPKFTNYTRGPWFVDVHEKYTNIEGETFTIAENVSNDDANLIAAAPDLLEAAKSSLLYVVMSVTRDPIEEKAREEVKEIIQAAIAKAEGRE